MEQALDEGELARLYRRGIVAITVAGALLRLVMLASKWNQNVMLNDSIWYSGQAHQLANYGRFFEDFFAVSGAEHTPLTSILITPASLLPHYQFFQRATITLAGIAFIPVIAMVARRVGGRRAGMLAAAIAALYPNVWLGDALIMSETFALLLVALTLLAALRYRDRPTVGAAVLTGALIGLAALARAELLLFAPILAFVGVRAIPFGKWIGRAAALVAAALLVIAPWALYNQSRYEHLVLLSTNDGTTLLGANCPATYAGPALGGWVLKCLDELADFPNDDASQDSVRRRRAAVDYALEHVDQLPKVATARFLRMLDLYGLDDLVRGDLGEERPRWAIWAGIACWWVLAPLAAIGLWRSRQRAGIVLFTPVICVVVTAVAFYGSHRLRAPVEPSVVTGAALCLAGWLQHWTPQWMTRVPRREAIASPA